MHEASLFHSYAAMVKLKNATKKDFEFINLDFDILKKHAYLNLLEYLLIYWLRNVNRPIRTMLQCGKTTKQTRNSQHFCSLVGLKYTSDDKKGSLIDVIAWVRL